MADNHKEDFLQKQLNEANRAAELYNSVIKTLQTEPRFIEFFKGYNQKSVESFIQYYAQQKVHWVNHADGMVRLREHKNNKWRKEAINLLKEIYLKKLFNLKCRWEAGEMDLPGIEASVDFLLWRNSGYCPFVEPITQAEFDCYLQFIVNEQHAPDDSEEDEAFSGSAIEWYHIFRATYNTGQMGMIPRWFHFYDRHFETAHLLHISNIRADKEAVYDEIWSEQIYFHTLTDEQKKKWHHESIALRKDLYENPEKAKIYYEEQKRLYYERKKNEPQYISLSTYDDELMEELMKEIETSEIRGYHRAIREWQKRRDGNEDIQTQIWELEKVKEWIPLEENEDYRNAISKAYDLYAQRMIQQTLPHVFEEYLQCMQAGKPFEWNERNDTSALAQIAETKRRILEARKHKGEPANFDFLKKENLNNE